MPLRTSAKGGCKWKIARIENEYAEDIWAPFFWFPFSWDLLIVFCSFFMSIWTALGQRTLCYVRWSRVRLWHKVPMFTVLQCNVSDKRGVPPDRGEGSQPTYGPSERRASYVNMKNLAKGRIRIVRKLKIFVKNCWFFLLLFSENFANFARILLNFRQILSGFFQNAACF